MKRAGANSRRSFLKVSAAGAAGVAIGGVAPRAVSARSTARQAAADVNPAIPNLRVVCCHDPKMVNKSCSKISNFKNMANQNGAANTAPIQANLDAMARQLAKKKTAAEAWAAIFQRGSKKWSDIRVAVKVNGISYNHPRLAIVDKVCKELHTLGVPYGNIIIYDGCHNAKQHYSQYVGTRLPAGVKVSDKSSLLGGTAKTKVPGPFSGSYSCTRHIADGTVDILVNCAVNKGHGASVGGITLSMKNHFGTFTPKPKGHGDFNYVVAINKSNAILGGNPTRQQLCIVDALWSMTRGPQGTPNKDTHRLIMGTFGPAVDFATIRKIREKVMGVKSDSKVGKIPSHFGYTATQFNKMEYIEFKPGAEPTLAAAKRGEKASPVSMRWNRRVLHLTVPEPGARADVSLFSANGRRVATLFSGKSTSRQIRLNVLDKIEQRGLSRGHYLIRANVNGQSLAKRLELR